MSDRKYSQHGYQDKDRERAQQRERPPQKTQQPRQPKGSHEGPRPMQMPGFQEVLRCAMCGAFVPPPIDITFESRCPKCSADLRCCKNCGHFDTGARFECTQQILERITKKDMRNTCEFFVARASIERETRDSGGVRSNPSSTTNASNTLRPSDARSAFDNLFKK